MKETKFFILIPVYNVEQYLHCCLDSILSQDYSEYEVILVNDGSKDASGEICDQYAASHESVHVIHKKNGGQISARLAAIDFVRQNRAYANSYSIFVDSDDELAAGALSTINKKILSSACDMLIYGYEKFNDAGVFYTTLEEKTSEKLIDDTGELLRESVIAHSYNSLCRKAVRTEMLFFEMSDDTKDIRMGEDLLQSIGIYRQGPRTLIIPDLLYRYRVNPSSATQIFHLKRFTDDLWSRYYAVKQIKELNVWNNDDFEGYLDKTLFVLEWDIRHLLSESPSRRDALNNLKQLHIHPFVQAYCAEKICTHLSCWLREFSKGHFKRLWLLHKLSMIKNAVKEKKKIGR